jgi:hypothetical protein
MFGTIFGAVLTSMILRSGGPSRFDEPQFRPDRVIGRLTRELDLSAEQSSRIREIFRAQYAELRTIREQTEPRIREVLDATHDRVQAELTAEQQALWEEKFETMRRRMRAPGWDRARGGGPAMRGVPDPERQVKRHDRDGDKQLSFEEAAGAWELSLERFERLDRNEDGFLEAGEIAAARGLRLRGAEVSAPAEPPNE